MNDITKITEKLQSQIGDNFNVNFLEKNSDEILVFKCDNKLSGAIPSILFIALNPITNELGMSPISPKEAVDISRKRG